MDKQEFDDGFQVVKKAFEKCAPVFIALGDEARQHLILQIAAAGKDGINVSDLTGKSILSRPAISHHLKILKDSGLIYPEKKQTKIFYHINAFESLDNMHEMISTMESFINAYKADEPETT
jgi:DNA-binding transcriptional ArsR family regulator